MVIPRYDSIMSVEKVAASFDPVLLAEIREDAAQAGTPSLSAWLADAAQLKLRRHRAATLLAEHERRHGVITDAELAAVQSAWPA